MAKPDSPFTRGPKDPETGEIPGPAAPTTSELDILRQQIAELMRANEATKAELRENQAVVQRMLADGNQLDLVAIEAKRRRREAARRRIYAHVKGKRVVIQLHANEDPRRNYPVHLNLNGKFYDVPRGRPVEIEGEFLEVLDRAFMDHVTKEVDESGNPRLVHYDLFYYPYQVLRGLEGLDNSDVVEAAA